VELASGEDSEPVPENQNIVTRESTVKRRATEEFARVLFSLKKIVLLPSALRPVIFWGPSSLLSSGYLTIFPRD
jgi:hypothetical protein